MLYLDSVNMEADSGMNLKPNGDVLKWARETEHKDIPEIARSLSVTDEEVVAWEGGEKTVPLGILRRFSTLYQRPISFFFLPQAPTTSLITPEFRTFDSIKNSELSAQTLLALRKTKFNRELYVDLLERLKEPYKFNFPAISIEGNPEVFAAKVRKALKVPKDIHEKLTNKSAALRYWISLVEENGLLIFQYSLPRPERGFCLHGEEGLPPVIVLSSGEEPAGRIFTVFHELGHILIQEKANQLSYPRLEQFCNHFAGAFLVPKELLLSSKYCEKYLEDPSSDYWLSRLTSEFKVSAEVILRRLRMLNKITQSFYLEKVLEIKAQQDKRIQKKEETEKDGFLAPARKSFMNTGITMSSKLFEAHERGVIGTAELVRNFQSTSHTLPAIKAELSAAKKIYVG